MCGFVGAFGPATKRLHPNLERALDSIAHRGPDHRGTFQSESCFLGHLRLSILDLNARANQPMRRDEEILVYNGQIYNHKAIRANELSREKFSTESDTETLLVGFQKLGSEILERLTGMFAGAFYDKARDELLLFRDGLGIKPLYFTQLSDSSVLFASEIKALFSLDPELPRRASKENLALYLRFENYPQGVSLFERIELLKPGEVLCARLENGRVVLHRKEFSRTKSTAILPTEYADLVEETRSRIERSVKEHLQSDVPIGVYLSGGIDSSLVASLAARQNSSLQAFTGYFANCGSEYDERPFANLVAKQIGTPLVEVPITPKDFVDSFDQVLWALDEPRMGMGSFSQYVVAREAGKHRKVILAGHGGDELFGGYPQFKAFWLMESGVAAPKTYAALFSLRRREIPWITYAILQRIRTGKLQFAPELFPKQNWLPDADAGAFVQSASESPLGQLHDYYQTTYLPGLLVVEDRISMAHSLETRVPLWSQSMDWALKIPLRQKLRGGQLKALLKDVARPLLPPELLSAPKRGFPTPLRVWFRDNLKSFVRERLLDGTCVAFPKKEIETLLRNHESVRLPFALDERRAHRIWILLCLESWARQFKISLEGLR